MTAASIAVLRHANAGRTFLAAERDRNLALIILDDERYADIPQQWADVVQARAESPESESWADIGASLGLTKDQAAGAWRRVTRSLGYLPRTPGDAWLKDRSS